MSLKLVLGRTTNATRLGPIMNRIIPTMEVSPLTLAFLLGLWTLLVQFTNNKEANMGLEQRNKSKTTYTPWAASMLDCVLRELENRVFPRVFAHCEPIRSHRLRSRD